MSGHDLERGIGRHATWAAATAVVLGIVALATGLRSGEGQRAVAELIASWMFFAGIAAGAAAFRAFFRIVDARWTRPLAPLAGVYTAFAPAAALVLAVILARAAVVPWVATPTGWLSTRNVAVRELAANALLLGLAVLWFGARPGKRNAPTRARAIAYCVVFAVVLSVWGFDFVLGPDPVWSSTLIGAHVFMSAFLGGAGAVLLLGLALGALGEQERRDAGALVFALAIFWLYLFWSQFLTMWYANLPDEIAFGLRRAIDGWGWTVLAVIGLVFVVPFLGLIHPAGRRSPPFFAAVLAVQLVGLWLQLHLLVVPSLSARGTPPITWRDLLIALGTFGAFTLSVAPGVRRAAALGRADAGGDARSDEERGREVLET